MYSRWTLLPSLYTYCWVSIEVEERLVHEPEPGFWNVIGTQDWIPGLFKRLQIRTLVKKEKIFGLENIRKRSQIVNIDICSPPYLSLICWLTLCRHKTKKVLCANFEVNITKLYSLIKLANKNFLIIFYRQTPAWYAYLAVLVPKLSQLTPLSGLSQVISPCPYGISSDLSRPAQLSCNGGGGGGGRVFILI